MRLLMVSTLILGIARSATAAFGVAITLPGTTLVAGTAYTIQFADNGGSPSLSQLVTGTVQICVGGNTANTYLTMDTVSPVVTYAQGLTTTITIPASIAGNVPNGFFLKVISSIAGGGVITNFSPRFSMSGMTGTTQASIVADANGLTSPPDDISAGVGAAAPGDQFAVPYNLQTGLTKYAPMQPVPPTKISKKNPTPMYPTSAYVKATTWLPRPTVLSTLTLAQTFKVVSIENTAAPQPMPNGDMAKFLARWRD